MINTVYQLSLFIHSIDIDKSVVAENSQIRLNNQIWFVLSIDGSDAPISTSAVQLQPHSEFNYGLDIQFIPPSTGICNLFWTLCTFADDDNSQLIAMARAKVAIDKLPLNGANAFRIPLMTKSDSKKKDKSKKKGNIIKTNLKGEEYHQVATILVSGIIDPPLDQKQESD